MPFPNVPEKYQGRAVLSPQDMLAYRQQAGMLPKGPGPRAVILCLQRGLSERMARAHPLKKFGRMNGDLFTLKETKGEVAVLTNFGLGAPQMAGLAEEFIAWGVKQLVSISMCGGLQPDLKSGDIIVCNRSIRDEGTSHHYLPDSKFVEANPELVKKLAAALALTGASSKIGATWTTDATYRETDVEIEQYASEGVLSVEMETAALFAVAQVRNVPAASVFVVGDSLAGGRWQQPTDFKLLDRKFDEVYQAVSQTLGIYP